MDDTAEITENDSATTYRGAVIYTDGSARPNPGNTGWGFHGYLYVDPVGDKKAIAAKGNIVTEYGYTHPCELGQNPRAVPTQPALYLDGYGTGASDSTNNAAEIDALYFALLKLKEYSLKKIQILTDSEYVRKRVTQWRPLLEGSGFRGPDGNIIKNAERWKAIYAELDALKAAGIELSIDWVKGHNDIYGNVMADELATIAVLHKSRGIDQSDILVSPIKGYWKTEVDRHPFISHKNLYFNSQAEYNTVGKYYLANPGSKDSNQIGKKTPTTAYSVIRLSQPDTAVEMVIKQQCDISGDASSIMLMRLDRLYTPNIYKRLIEHGSVVLYSTGKYNVGLNYIDNKPITTELNPSGLSLRAIEAMTFLDGILEMFLTSGQNSGTVQYHDVTDQFFDTVEGKKGPAHKLKGEITNAITDLTIQADMKKDNGDISRVSVLATLGSDIPARNNLKKIESLSPVVKLAIWYESETTFRYAIILRTETDSGIWSNFYSNKILF